MKTRLLILMASFIIFLCDVNAQMKWDEKYYKSMQWRLVGPFRGGRSCAVAGIENKPNEYFMGATGGGVWKTTNGGSTWKNISDGFFGGSIGSVEVAASDPNVIYVGEGEETIRGNMSSGHGIWKTEDGGKTWNKIGLEKTKHIVRIRTHPKNSEIVLVAALGNVFKAGPDRGIYKTIDGGKIWKRVLFINDSTGISDLVYDPENPRILYAGSWNVQRNAYQLSSGGNGSALWKSMDGGDTWKNISKSKGLPEGLWGKVTVSVSGSNHDRIYAMVENENGGLFRSDDGGQNWTIVNSNRELRQRAWYFSRVYADPQNENIVYVLNVSFHKSMDGGKTFVTMPSNHGDHHDLWINPKNSQRMILADDGGAQITDDGGRHWSSLDNQPTAQFYRISTDNHVPFRIYAAQQDNSTIRIAHRTSDYSIGREDWEPTAGGESGHIAVDPLNPEIVYGGSYGGYLTRYDHSKKISRNINVWPDNPIGHGAEKLKYRFQWNFPIYFSPHNPKRLYCASNKLHVTENEGQSWETISPDLTRNDTSKLKSSGGPITKDNTSVEYYCTIFSVVESPLKSGTIWVGSDDGLVHLTKNGGQSWMNVTPVNLPEWTQINSLEADPFNEAGCYLAATAYKNGDFKPYLFKTEDNGKSWKLIVNGIAGDHFTRVIRADHKNKGLLFAGTEYGMYLSFDDGSNWKPFQLNLPIVPITDLTIRENFIIAATQGRSIWMIDDINPLRQIQSMNVTKPQTLLFQPKPMIRMGGGTFESLTNGTNHPNGLIVHYYIDTLYPKDTIKLYCIDQRNDTVSVYSNFPESNEYKLDLISGSNRMIINPRVQPAKSFDGMVMWGADLSGPRALPGIYKLHIHSRSNIDSTNFEIVADPIYPVSARDIQLQYEFVKKVRDRLDEAHRCIIQIRDIRKQLNDFTSSLNKNLEFERLTKLKTKIDSSLTSIENELYQTKSRSNQDPINYPIKLTNKLAHLSDLTAHGSYPPTDQAEACRQELDKLIADQLNAFNLLKTQELKQFNQAILDLQLEVIKPKEIK